jgi:hypothetical protein
MIYPPPRKALVFAITVLILWPFITLADQPEVLGNGVTAGDAVPVKALLIDPERYVGKTVVVDGIVTSIGIEDSRRIRISESDGVRAVNLELPPSGFVVPEDAVGRRILAEGRFDRIEPEPGKVGYIIRVTGAVLS